MRTISRSPLDEDVTKTQLEFSELYSWILLPRILNQIKLITLYSIEIMNVDV